MDSLIYKEQIYKAVYQIESNRGRTGKYFLDPDINYVLLYKSNCNVLTTNISICSFLASFAWGIVLSLAMFDGPSVTRIANWWTSGRLYFAIILLINCEHTIETF